MVALQSPDNSLRSLSGAHTLWWTNWSGNLFMYRPFVRVIISLLKYVQPGGGKDGFVRYGTG